jgi:hypothetical protein
MKRYTAHQRFTHPKKPAYGFYEWYVKCPVWELEELLPKVQYKAERQALSELIASKNHWQQRKNWRAFIAAVNRCGMEAGK